MPSGPISIGPWMGIDNVHLSDAGVFQPRGELEKRLPALVSAENVDLDNDGWPQRRIGFTRHVALDSGLELFVGAGLVLVQDGGTIKQFNPADRSTVDLVTGLAADERVIFHLHAGQVFWTNGEVTGRILTDGTALNWGCAVPSIQLANAIGTLRAGRYLVAATFVDVAGVEHGAGEAEVIVLADGQAISVDIPSLDSAAISVRLYASKPNNTELFFVGDVAVGALPAVIDDVEVSEEPLRTQFLAPPLAGDGLFSYRGVLVLFAETFLFPSYGVNTHLFEIADVIEARPTQVLAGAGLADGFWTLCEDGAYWTTGDVPENWQTWQRDERTYAAGALVLSGSLLPALQTPMDVALFVSEHGLVAGLPGGALMPLQQDRLRLDVAGKRASIVYSEQGQDLRQVLFTLE